MEFQPIAEQEVICCFPEGRRGTIRLCIGQPRPAPGGDWECPVSAEGLYERLPPIVGVDSWQVLNLALRLLEELIKNEVARGASLKWPFDDEPITVGMLFSRGDAKP